MKSIRKLSVALLAFSFILTPFTSVSAQEATTTTYPSKYYNIDSNGKVTKHIFANGVEVATIEGTGSAAKVNYIHTDNLGSTNVVTDETGAVVETLDYLPFGGVRVDKKENAFSEQRKYIGQEYDETTKLNYLNARYYDSSAGKFLSQDPVFLNLESQGKEIFNTFLTDPQSQNSYSYAKNNPITLSDSEGKWYEEYLTGKQSWNDFSGEVGEATQYMSNGWQTAMEHPYVPGIIGVTPLAVYGATIAGTQIMTGIRLGTLSQLPMADRVDTLVNKGFDAIQKATGLTKTEAIQTIQNTGKSLVEMRPQNLGKINNTANVGDKVIRITTTPNASKIISSGVLGSVPKLQQYISSGAMQALPTISSAAKFITKLVK